jgi:arginine decarboxylase
MIVLPVIDAIGPTRATYELPPLEGEVHAVVRDMQELARDVNLKNYREVFNEAVSNKDTMHSLFDLGYVTLLERAYVEQLYHRTLLRIAKVVEQLDYVPEELEALPKRWPTSTWSTSASSRACPTTGRSSSSSRSCRCTACRRSPTREATLVDISCDSDGKIQKFIDLRDVKSTLPVHDLVPGQAVLPRGVPHRRVPGRAGQQPQPVRAHERGARAPRGGRRLAPRALRQRPEGAARDREHGLRDRELHGWLQDEIREAERSGTKLSDEEKREVTELYDAELVGYTYLEQV